MRNKISLVAATIATAVLVVGCGNADPPPVALDVALDGYRFPDGLRVATGGEVTFTSSDAEPHKVEIEGVEVRTDAFGPGEQAVVVAPDVAGSYDLLCLLHPSMTGSIEVAAR